MQLGAPLPLPQITARIVTIESNTAPAYTPLEGRVDHVVVKLGEVVAAGTQLALVRSGELASMLRALRSSSALALTKRALANRMQVLVEARGASENALLVAKNDLRDAELQAHTADSRLKSLSIAPVGDNLFWLLAPRGGVVTQIDATPGQSVQVGDPVDIRIPGDNDSLGSGVIENISQVVDPERQTVPIRARAKNPQHHLRPNAFVEVHTSSGTRAGKTVLQVLTQAVVSDGLETVVFLLVEPGHYRRTEVTVSRQNARVTEIRAGLKPGDRVVSRGALLLLNALDAAG